MGIIGYSLNIDLSYEDTIRYVKMLLATGYIKDHRSVRGGGHTAISLNEDGYKLMMEHGTYLSFLNSKTKSTKSNDRLQELNIMITRLKIISVIIGIIASLVALFLGIQTYKLENRINVLEELLHKNSIEIPK